MPEISSAILSAAVDSSAVSSAIESSAIAGTATTPSFKLGMLATAGLALIMFLIGKWVVKKVAFLRKYYIPAAVVGGLIFALVNMVLALTGVLNLSFDPAVKDITMALFFTSVGYMASLSDLKKGGIGVVLLLACTAGLVFIQNLAGVGLCALFDIDDLRVGVLVGSVPYTGGNGTAVGFTPTFDQLGITYGGALGNAAAAIGLVLGGLLGGPMAKMLLKKSKTTKGAEIEGTTVDKQPAANNKMDPAKTLEVLIILFICMGIGELIKPGFDVLLHKLDEKLSLPSYIPSMFLAIIFRNVQECVFKKEIATVENEKAGNIALEFFLSIAMTTLNLAQLFTVENIKVGLVLLCSIPMQVIIVALYVRFVTFNVMGRDYDAVVISCGHCGYGLGATPTAIANMDTFCKKNGKSIKAYLTVPLVGAFFLDFVNIALISLFLTIFK